MLVRPSLLVHISAVSPSLFWWFTSTFCKFEQFVHNVGMTIFDRHQ
jgi:hypothetical protein